MLRELETKRLALREMRLEDAPALQAWQNCPAQWRHMAMEPEEFADGAARIARYLEHRGAGDQRRLFVYVAILKSSGALVATAGLSRYQPAVASLGLSVASSHGARGYGTELATRLLGYGFEDLGLHRIDADVAIENLACMRVLEKVGMVREGIARDCIRAQGRWWTEAKFAILRTDRLQSV